MSAEILEMTQNLINFLAWFMIPFAVFVVVDWIISLFRNDY